MSKPKRYRLSARAEADFLDVFFFGLGRFGIAKTREYSRGMIAYVEFVAENPELFQVVNRDKGYRRAVYKSHAIFFVERGSMIDVLRISHGQDTSYLFS